MNLSSILVTLSLASSVAVSSTPVAKQLLSISPRDFAHQFNAVAHRDGSGLTLPDFRIKPGWHRASTSDGVSVLVRAAEGGHALSEVVVVCRAVEHCLATISMTARALDESADAALLQRFIAARIAAQLDQVALVMSGLVYLVVAPTDDDYVALVIRPYAPHRELTAPLQARLRNIGAPVPSHT
ncbi:MULTISPECIES: malto-oligosyltrehalose synthase [unclassified Cupriavidus]|uniref:malto-oligosyltrehalose synthase n=1 Tax=Cupriavidus sp. H19C3 TaxID=3241603 RepID=UPI0011DC0A7C|nr:MAG: malto-oligosyltrehalose synthase [Cupriavidus sp.]